MADALAESTAKLFLDEETGEMVSKNELKKRTQKRTKKAAQAAAKHHPPPHSLLPRRGLQLNNLRNPMLLPLKPPLPIIHTRILRRPIPPLRRARRPPGLRRLRAVQIVVRADECPRRPECDEPR